MGEMRDHRPYAVEAAFAQPLTDELLSSSDISPGMRVLALGRGLADLALRVAERVGPSGAVIGVHPDGPIAAAARRRATEECFEWVTFHAKSLERIKLHTPVDAVVGRFFLMHQRNPVRAIRLAAGLVREGGRVVFQEWHYGSILWPETSGWPQLPLYEQFARLTIEGLRRRRAHVDMGLRLANAYAEAGLGVPLLRMDLRVVPQAGSLGYAFFEETMRKLLPTIERCGLARAVDVAVDTFAQRLERETVQSRGHLFLPLQVGAWATVGPRNGAA